MQGNTYNMADRKDSGSDGDVEKGRVDGKLVVGGILAVVLLLTIVQNTDDTSVNFLFWDVTAPLWIVLLVTAGIAIVIWELVSTARRRRRAKREKHKR